MSTDAAIRDLEESIRACVDHSRLFDLYGALGRLQAMAGFKLFAPPPTSERLISASEAAPRLGISSATLYREADRYPFTVREGRRVRFSETGIRDYLRRTPE
jgi:predicted DNA-binding transcriptional regulator AlpA